MPKELKTFTRAEVEKHNSDGDNYLIIDGGVYDVSNFASMHPGGESLLNEIAGTDATEQFYGLHRQEVLDKYRPRLLVGYTDDADIPEDDGLTQWGRISQVPYAETFNMRDGYHSPYHNEKHKEFRQYCRESSSPTASMRRGRLFFLCCLCEGDGEGDGEGFGNSIHKSFHPLTSTVSLCMGVQQLLSTLSALICHSLPRVHQPRQTGGMRLSPPAASGRDLAMQLATPCACAFAIAMEMCCLQ